jgi:orotate phosphoribosyltransferase
MNTQETSENTKTMFIRFLLESGVLTFGDFTLKSGRKAPYFVNSGNFDNAAKISKLATFYAREIVNQGITDTETIFGPAYKGIPLCVATAEALYREYQLNVGFSFNRKEAKTHGEKGSIVGRPLVPGMRVLIVEDVLTAGTTLREVIGFLREQYQVKIQGVILSVDRCERGMGESSARSELEHQLGLRCFPLVTVFDLLEFLEREQAAHTGGFAFGTQHLASMRAYIESNARAG